MNFSWNVGIIYVPIMNGVGGVGLLVLLHHGGGGGI